MYAGGLTCTLYSLYSLFFFLLLLMFLNESCTRWEYRRKCQEQSAQTGAELFRNDTCERRDQSTEKKSNSVFVPFRLPESRWIKSDLHDYVNQTRQSPSATPSHMGIAQSVTKKAFVL